jgi:hypothetical protein
MLLIAVRAANERQFPNDGRIPGRLTGPPLGRQISKPGVVSVESFEGVGQRGRLAVRPVVTNGNLDVVVILLSRNAVRVDVLQVGYILGTDMGEGILSRPAPGSTLLSLHSLTTSIRPLWASRPMSFSNVSLAALMSARNSSDHLRHRQRMAGICRDLNCPLCHGADRPLNGRGNTSMSLLLARLTC